MSQLISRRRLMAFAAVLALAAACAALTGMVGNTTREATDDAFVAADFTLVSPRIAGQIAALTVDDNQAVKRGQLLAQIDDRDYAAALEAAQADVAVAQAALDHASTRLVQQRASIAQADAGLAESRANHAFARADLERYADLARHGAGSTQSAEQARARADMSAAAVARDSAASTAARQQVDVLNAQRAQAEGTLQRARAALDTARLRLSYTRIVAPVDGVVGQRAARVGAYVTPGSPLLAVVPLRDAYVIANFQENQLTRVRAGQRALVRVDTYPDRRFSGSVDSIAPATGATFAAIAPDNATGNFTKVVQRIPVKIVLDPGQAAREPLRAGMSVVAEIDTASTPAGRTSR
ncbi:HlyD family secretion protein [Burkholderia sp. FERM BP-3421]|uniref:HlyD family secretion protein n=1 Tax=Burkholderia sp. FERM BP-3421 TaxID=1494466 RepID=UPI00235F64FA|nr:HlyD family secretion protein [Burkholderia sp. FERM BP-3421]WDD93001.1 HlyD family secretion protein [Burkholderia sp. FERM BP-3421]